MGEPISPSSSQGGLFSKSLQSYYLISQLAFNLKISIFHNLISSIVGHILVSMVGVITKTLLLINSATTLLVQSIGSVLIGIGIIIGPILVPWIILPKSSFVFDSWMKFMLSSSMIQLVASCIMLVNMDITKLIFNTIVESSDKSPYDQLANMSTVCILSIINIVLMFSCTKISNKLVSGISIAI